MCKVDPTAGDAKMWALLALTAAAYETDQLTFRTRPLRDATDTADALVEPMLARAVDRANRRTRCQGDEGEMREALARAIHRETGGKVWVISRGLFRAPGFSRYSAALVRSPAERIAFERREDIYGDMTLWQSVILTLGGPCPTFVIAGVRIGSDKLDHFFDLGWQYFHAIEKGKPEAEAIAAGARTEVQMYGMLTSKTFAFADLKANWDGLGFYRALLTDDSVFRRGEDGCVEQVAPWRWDAWVDADWDEVENPGVHTRLVQRRLTKTLEERREVVCAERDVWDAEGERDARMADLNADQPWIRGRVPLRDDPYQLAALCDPEWDGESTPARPHHFVER